MRIFALLMLMYMLMVSAGCYPVGHRYHDQNTHQQHIDQMNNPDPPAF